MPGRLPFYGGVWTAAAEPAKAWIDEVQVLRCSAARGSAWNPICSKQTGGTLAWWAGTGSRQPGQINQLASDGCLLVYSREVIPGQ